MTDKRKSSEKYSSLTGIHRAVPIILFAVSVFTLFCFITQNVGALGYAISAVLLGLFSYGAYSIPLLLALHAIFYPSDKCEQRVLSRVIFSMITITFISALSHSIAYWNEDIAFNAIEFFKNGQSSVGGGFIGGIVGYCIVKIFGEAGLIIIAAAIFAIYISYFFAGGQRSISKVLFAILKGIVFALAFIERKIKGLFGSVKNAKSEKLKRNAEQKNLELTDDEFFAVDNGMQKLSVSKLDIKETRNAEDIEENPTLHDKIFYKSAVSKEEAEEMAMREKAEELFYSAPVAEDEGDDHVSVQRRRIVNVSYDDPDSRIGRAPVKTEPKEEPALSDTVVTAQSDDSAESIFTQSFDPFSLVMAEELAEKRSSRSLLDESPRQRKATVTEDISELTEEDIERRKQIEEFERRKAAIVNARRAIPVENDGEFRGTPKNVDFRERTEERHGETPIEAPTSSFIFDKVEKRTEPPKAEPANYTAIGFGSASTPVEPIFSKPAFTVPETIYSYEPPKEENPEPKREGYYSSTVYVTEKGSISPESKPYIEEPEVQIFERKIPKAEPASAHAYTVSTHEEEKPTFTYADPKPSFEERPAFSYTEPKPIPEERPAFSFTEPKPMPESVSSFGYTEPKPMPETGTSFGYTEPKPMPEEKPEPVRYESASVPTYTVTTPTVEAKTPDYREFNSANNEAPAPTYKEPAPAMEQTPALTYTEPGPAKEAPAFSYATTKDFGEEKSDEYVPEFKPYQVASAEELSETEERIEDASPEEVSTLTIERERIGEDEDTEDEYTDQLTDDEDEDEDDLTPPDGDDDGGYESEEIPAEEQNPVVQGYKDMFSALRDSEDEDESEENGESDENDSDADGYNDGYDDDEDYDAPPFAPSSVTPEPKPEKPKKEEKPEKKKPDFSKYRAPSIDLLGLDPAMDDDTSEINENTKILIDTLASFGVTASIKGVDRGPRITRYEVVPARGVKVNSITNLFNDIALNLAKEGIRMEAPIPGKSAIGFEIPNKNPKNVRLRELLECEEFVNAKSKTYVGIGKDVAGNPVFGDIAKYPHALICGATGMGKSVCINSIMISMLYKARPDEVRFIMIDPKKVEFRMYSGIPHLLIPVITEAKQAAGALMWAVEEMERRYELIEKNNIRNIEAYNEKVLFDTSLGEPLPKIVIVIDELADLMMQVRDPVEDLIMRIAQKARAAGIHLIIGTQRPSVQVITGAIKANIPSRISCKVTSQVDSRTIFDMGGAEKLLNRGDMLYWPVDKTKALRVQGAFVSDPEVEAIMEFLKSQVTDGAYDDEVFAEINKAAQKCGNKKSGGGVSADDIDDGDEECGYYSDQQFLDAVELAIRSRKVSTSLLQRKLSIGYGKAAKYIDAMEELGIVSEPKGQKPRDVLLSMDDWHEKLSRVSLD